MGSQTFAECVNWPIVNVEQRYCVRNTHRNWKFVSLFAQAINPSTAKADEDCALEKSSVATPQVS